MKWIHRVSKESGWYCNFSPGLPLTSVHFHYNLRHRKSQKKIGILAIAGLTALGVVMVAIIWTSVYGL